MAKSSGDSFPFIVSSGPKVPQDPTLRTLIRKQAMKDVGVARRKRGDYGKVNMRQPMASKNRNSRSPRSEDSASESATRCVSASSNSTLPEEPEITTEATTPDEIVSYRQPAKCAVSTQDFEIWMLPLSSNPITAYEALRIKYSIDIQDLSVLTGFNVGQTTMEAIAEEPGLLMTLLGHRMASYLEYIPSRYGHSPILTAVVDCVVAKIHSAIYPHDKSCASSLIRLYSKALRALQDAISDERSCGDPDVLCAVEMLSLHELLDPRRSSAYTHHIEGSAQMIRHRTPRGFTSDYEKHLFLAHVGPIFSESLYKGQACYIEEPQWMRLYESLIEDTCWLTERSRIVVTVHSQVVRLASMLLMADQAMRTSPTPDGGLLMTMELKARSAHQTLLDCLEEYKMHVVRTATLSPPESELSLRREVYGEILECLALYKRVIGVVCEEERLQREFETQELARLLVKLQKEPGQRHSWIFSRQEQEVATVLIETRHEWEEDLSGASPAEIRHAACKRWKNLNWCLHHPGIGMFDEE